MRKLTSLVIDLTQTGVTYARSASERRNILLTNGLSIIASLAVFAVALMRYIYDVRSQAHESYLHLGPLIFLAPILLNRFGFTFISRMTLTWLPSIFVTAMCVLVLSTEEVSSSWYTGMRYYLLALCCPSFLVFDIPKEKGFFVAITVPFALLILFDPFLESLGLGLDAGVDPDYEFNNVRALVSLMVVGSACFILKSRADRNEDLNVALINELADKNEEIRQQASDQVHKLNQELVLRLKQLSEREFALNQSQRIAKVGSWEYNRQGTSIFWSEEMYSIFGLDPTYDLKTRNLEELIGGETGQLVIKSIGDVLKTGEPFDISFNIRTPLGYNKWLRINAIATRTEKEITGVRGICHDITYFKEAEELLRASDKKYRALFEQASDAILMTDFKGNFTDVNSSFCKMFGYTRDELLHMSISSVIDPEELKRRPILLSNLIEGAHIMSDRRMVARDGTIYEVEANVKRIDDHNLMAIVRDVTELRKVQRQIQLSEAKFRGAFEYSAIGMTILSPDGRWMQVNREFANMVGYTEEELVGRHFSEVTYPDDIATNEDLFNEAVRGKKDVYRLEKRYIHRNGSIVWGNLNVSMIKDENGKPVYSVAQIENITQEKEAREMLIVSQANLRATINNTNIMIWSVDKQFRLLAFNELFRAYLKNVYGVEARVGERIFGENLAPDHEELVQRWTPRYNRALSGETFELEEHRTGQDFHYSMSPIVEADEIIGATIFAENVTKRKAHDRELAEANKKIDELKLMALRSVMSPHFIFNVLNSIQYFIAKNDRLNAINYLSTFSKLIRSILNHSVTKQIPLADELEMLRNYVQLEMTRFEQKFDFTLDVSPAIDIESVEIPSLLIQPYVENAILHGLYNKKSHGSLWIRVMKGDDTVVFEIEDNGVGRAEAMRIREKNFPTHKSMGIRVTEERLKLIRQQNNAVFEIEDLVDTNGPCGTKVRIHIPHLEEATV